MKFFVLCLIAGLFLSCVSEKTQTGSSAMRTPASESREGSYKLITGTQGCPTSLIWIEQCAGFVLNPYNKNEELDTEKFCHLNRGVKVTNEEGIKAMTQVEQTERYIRKAATVVNIQGQSFSSEDTLIFDMQKDQFLWEHSKNHKGFSCLYSK